MYIEKQTVRGHAYIRLVENVVKRNESGETKISKKVLKVLGRLEDLDDGRPDFMQRLRTSFREGRPLLPELMPFVDGTLQRVTELEFVEGSADCRPERQLFAGALLDRYFSDLGLTSLLGRIRNRSRIQYDLTGVVKLLVYGRLLCPSSKIAAAAQNEAYFIPPANPDLFSPKNVYKALDELYAGSDLIQRTMHRRLSSKMKRDTSVVFYDVTNTFFETDTPDEDITDESGECMQKGLRKRGKSKEGRRDPIVQVALFMDSNGIPLSVEVFPGNVPDVSTLKPMLEKTLNVTGLGKFIFVADRGICSKPNCLTITQNGGGYIVARSILRSSREHQDWVMSNLDMQYETPDFSYKSKIVTEKVKDSEGVEHELREKVIVYWSRKYCEKQRAEHDAIVQLLRSMEDDGGGVPLEKLEKKYVKKAFQNSLAVRSKDGKPSGEMIPRSQLREIIDRDKLQRQVDLFGYYEIVTSETETPDLQIIQTYKQLVQIETEFRDMKGILDLRPVYVRTPEHIKAHMLLCFIALTIMRLIQLRILDAHPAMRDSELRWTWGLSGVRLRAALNNWQLVRMPSDYFAFTRAGGKKADSGVNADLDVVLSAFDISIPLKLFTKGELRRMGQQIHVFR